MGQGDRDVELETMTEISRLLGEVDDATAGRVVRWLADRHGVMTRSQRTTPNGAGPDGDAVGADLAGVYEAANPSTTSERVMVVAYWFQVVQGETDVDSQKINSELKQLGHGVKNITRAFSELIGVRPQLVIQVRKAGSTRQARKRYRLTTEGVKRVKTLLAGGSTDE